MQHLLGVPHRLDLQGMDAVRVEVGSAASIVARDAAASDAGYLWQAGLSMFR